MGTAVIKKQADVDLGTSNMAVFLASVAQGLTAASENAKARQAQKDAMNAKIGEMFMAQKFRVELEQVKQQNLMQRLGLEAMIATGAREEAFNFDVQLRQMEQAHTTNERLGNQTWRATERRWGEAATRDMARLQHTLDIRQDELNNMFRREEREAGEEFTIDLIGKERRSRELEAEAAYGRSLRLAIYENANDITKLNEEYKLINQRDKVRFANTLKLQGMKEEEANRRSEAAISARQMIADSDNAMRWKIAELRHKTGGAGEWTSQEKLNQSLYFAASRNFASALPLIAANSSSEEILAVLRPLVEEQRVRGERVNQDLANRGIQPLTLYSLTGEPGIERWMWFDKPSTLEAEPVTPSFRPTTPAEELNVLPEATQTGGAAGAPEPFTLPKASAPPVDVPTISPQDSRKNLIALQTRLKGLGLPKQELSDLVQAQLMSVKESLTAQDYSALVEWLAKQPDLPATEE